MRRPFAHAVGLAKIASSTSPCHEAPGCFDRTAETVVELEIFQ
jgi:hypothetical protein